MMCQHRFGSDASVAIYFCVQVWVKPPEVLARDRLLGSYKVSVGQDCSIKDCFDLCLWTAFCLERVLGIVE